MASLITARTLFNAGHEAKRVFSYTLCQLGPGCLSVQKCSRVMNSTKEEETTQENAEKLLKNCVVDLNKSAGKMRGWSTEPYPKCEVSERNQALKRLDSNLDPRVTSIVLFPGQGSQYVGMGKNIVEYPEAKHVCDTASDFLGYDILELCASGPKHKLNRTEFSQLAVFVLSVATFEHLRHSRPDLKTRCVATAGFSVGELTALVFSGAISFIEGLELVKARAEAMQGVCNEIASGMITVFYSADSHLEYACLCAKKWCEENGVENPECRVANYLFPHCKVVAGHLKALEFIENNASQFKLKRVKRLSVSGAFHTPIMKPAAEQFKKTLKNVKVMMPKIPVYSNVDGKMYQGTSHIIKQLPQQIYKPVKWEQTLHILYERDQGKVFPFTIECGPGSSLKTCLKMVNAKAWNNCESVEL